MQKNSLRSRRKIVALSINIILIILVIKLDIHAFYVMLIASAIFGIGLYIDWDEYMNYKEQSQWNKLWLRCLAIAAAGIFISTLIVIIGVIFGSIQL
jgi:glucose-6-phosphate-specific signal transduction histidine kinase